MLNKPTRLGKTDEGGKCKVPEEHVGLRKVKGWTENMRQ
jgi:hypothetical protein